MKKASLLIVALLLAFSLSACNSKSTNSGSDTTATSAPVASANSSEPSADDTPVTLNILDNYGQDDTKGQAKAKVFEAFQKKYPNITIKEDIAKDSDIPTKLETAFVGGKEPDIVFGNWNNKLDDWEKQGVIVPVDDYMKQWGLDGQFEQAGLDNYTLTDKKLAAFPFEGFNWPVWYNMKVLNASGITEIPKTLDDVMADIPKIRNSGYEPYITAGNDGEGHQEFVMLVSEMLTDDEMIKVWTDGDWDNSHAVQGVKNFVMLRDAGFFTKSTPGMTNPDKTPEFLKGKIAMAMVGSWSYSTASNDFAANIQLGGLPAPADSAQGKPGYQVGFSAKGVYITRNGVKHIDAVQKLVTFLYDKDNIKKFVVLSSMIPPTNNVDVSETEVSPLLAKSLKIPEDQAIAISVAKNSDHYITSGVNIVALVKQFYLTDSGKMTADQILDALKQAWAQAKK